LDKCTNVEGQEDCGKGVYTRSALKKFEGTCKRGEKLRKLLTGVQHPEREATRRRKDYEKY